MPLVRDRVCVNALAGIQLGVDAAKMPPHVIPSMRARACREPLVRFTAQVCGSRQYARGLQGLRGDPWAAAPLRTKTCGLMPANEVLPCQQIV